jgi:hypothetical protein
MNDMTGAEPTPGVGMAADRRAAFEAELGRIQVKAGRAENERRFLAAGLGAMFVGAIVALVAFLASLTMDDSRNVISMSILAVFGLTIAVVGAAVFLRYALGRLLRFWLLRLIYEQRPAD